MIAFSFFFHSYYGFSQDNRYYNREKLSQDTNPWTTGVEVGQKRTLIVTYCTGICQNKTPLDSLLTVEITAINATYITFYRSITLPEDKKIISDVVEGPFNVPRWNFYFTSEYLGLTYPLVTNNMTHLKETILKLSETRSISIQNENAAFLDIVEIDWDKTGLNFNDFVFTIDKASGWVISLEIVVRDQNRNQIGEVRQKVVYEENPQPTIPLQISFFLIFLLVTFSLSFVFYRKKIKKESATNLSLMSLFKPEHRTFLHELYSKLIYALGNYSVSLINLDNMQILNEIKNNSTSKYDAQVISNLYPEQIRREVNSEIRARSILILVELAYQSTENKYSSYLSKALKIPNQTVSFELKRLVELNYIQPLMSVKTLQDTRLKYFDLTQKGITFLYLLKETIAYSLITDNSEKTNQ